MKTPRRDARLLRERIQTQLRPNDGNAETEAVMEMLDAEMAREHSSATLPEKHRPPPALAAAKAVDTREQSPSPTLQQQPRSLPMNNEAVLQALAELYESKAAPSGYQLIHWHGSKRTSHRNRTSSTRNGDLSGFNCLLSNDTPNFSPTIPRSAFSSCLIG